MDRQNVVIEEKLCAETVRRTARCRGLRGTLSEAVYIVHLYQLLFI